MNTTMVNFRMDTTLKEETERTCKSMGISMSSLFCLFAKQVVKKQTIPFVIEGDHFYSEENMNELERRINNEKNGTAVFEEHELVEV